jgi:hypothetical protein
MDRQALMRAMEWNFCSTSTAATAITVETKAIALKMSRRPVVSAMAMLCQRYVVTTF